MVEISELLRKALDAVEETDEDPRIGWAWVKAEYRASRRRAFEGYHTRLTVRDEGMGPLEEAIHTLLRDQNIRRVWRSEDLWSVVLSLLAAAHEDRSVNLGAATSILRSAPDVRLATAIANVQWESSPTTVGGLSVAGIKSSRDASAFASFLGLESRTTSALGEHFKKTFNELGPCVIMTGTSARQGTLADDEFERSIDDFVGLSLVLSAHEHESSTSHRRGSANRPGIRGLTLDRGALEVTLSKKGGVELGASVYAVTGWSEGRNHWWYSSDPLPLDILLDESARTVVGDILQSTDAIAQRLRVAARWYSRAVWADAEDDAALTVSVALDSMLSGKDAVPGAVSKGRFALLERDISAREARFRRYEEVYRVRSAIAHGGDASQKLAGIGGSHGLLKDAQWVARRLLELRGVSKPQHDTAFRELWSSIQWGTLDWAVHP